MAHSKVEKKTTLDVSYQYLSYFLEDDISLKDIHNAYESGQISSKELKDIAISELWKFMQKFQERRAKVTEEEISIFMDGNRALRLSARYNWAGQVTPKCPVDLIFRKSLFRLGRFSLYSRMSWCRISCYTFLLLVRRNSCI
jgi:hypothetical protein